jgi:glycosyltransferase involved in cell wall biosynthesis
LHVLFVGEVGLRKGVPYLLDALRALDEPRNIRAKLAGPVALSRRQLRRYGRWCEFIGAVPRSGILDLYRWADVLVLPSVCEGSATVTYEAMACGLPIITTPNSGSLVRDGIDGFIVPVRDAEALRSRISLLRHDQQLRVRMGAAARGQIGEISLEAYARRLLKALEISPSQFELSTTRSTLR